MNEYFGGLLKDALLRIMNDPDAGRDLTKSTGSRRLSKTVLTGVVTIYQHSLMTNTLLRFLLAAPFITYLAL